MFNNDDAVSLQPKQITTDGCWFFVRPLAWPQQSVIHLCKIAGITGFETNHSMLATAATQLYQLGVDNQLIIERTCHQVLRVCEA